MAVTPLTLANTYGALMNVVNAILQGQQGSLYLSSILSPATITNDQNNYFPSGLLTCNVLRLSSSQHVHLTGLQAAATDGQIVYIQNVGNFPITLVSQSSSSTSSNQFILGINSIDLNAYQNALVRYDNSLGKWVVLAGPSPVDSSQAAVEFTIALS